MERGVIVVDMPEYCDYCPVGRIFGFESGVECLIATDGQSRVTRYGIHVKKPEWCPIRPMPERVYHENYCDGGRYDKGWNECIEAIEHIQTDN